MIPKRSWTILCSPQQFLLRFTTHSHTYTSRPLEYAGEREASSSEDIATMETTATFPTLEPMTYLGERILLLRRQLEAQTKISGVSCFLIRGCVEYHLPRQSVDSTALRLEISQDASDDWLTFQSGWPYQMGQWT